MVIDLRKILKLMEEKYPGCVALMIFDDESGRITDNPSDPYDTPPLFEFGKSNGGIKGLVEHLQEKK